MNIVNNDILSARIRAPGRCRSRSDTFVVRWEAAERLIRKETERVSRLDKYYLNKRIGDVCKYNRDRVRDLAEALS